MKIRKERNLQIEMIPEKSLNYWKDNPRVHDKDMIERLSNLIRLHGICSPLVVWKKNMTVYKGNLSLKATRFLEIKIVPVVFRDFKSETQAVAYALSDNKSSEFAEWDDDILSRLMQVEELNLTPEQTGYTKKEFREIQLAWEVDFDKIELIEEDEEGELSIIKIRCPYIQKDEIINRIEKALKGYTDVKIN